MSKFSKGRRRQRVLSRKPYLEGVEARILLSFTPGFTRTQASSQFVNLNGQVGIPNGGINGTPLSTGPDTQIIASGLGIPTAKEIARNRFTAHFGGNFDIAAPRTSDQSAVVRLRASGAWTDILHGSLLSVVSLPNAGSNGSAVGIFEMSPKSQSVTGRLLLRVSGATGDASRPTPGLLNWVVDPASSGSYTYATGQGTIKLVYGASDRSHSNRTTGNVVVYVSGTLVRSGLIL